MKTDLNIIDNSEKIINLLKMLLKTKGTTYLRNNLIEYNGVIDEILIDEFAFLVDYKIQFEKTVTIFFYYLDKLYYFNSEVVKAQNKKIYLKIPKEIVIRVKRKTKRYNIKNYNLTCNIKLISSTLNRNITRQIKYAGMNLEAIYKELEEEKPDLPKIITLINNHKNDVFDALKIVLPVEKLANQVVINFIKTYNKPFLLNNGLEEKSYFVNPFPEQVLTYKNYFDLLKQSDKQEVDTDKIVKTLVETSQKSQVYSVLYMPIIISKKVFGIIEVTNTVSSRREFDLNAIDYFTTISAILTEVIIKNKLNSIDESALNIKVLDLSLSGIGIEIEDLILINYLTMQSRLKISMDLASGKELLFIGEVKNINRIGSKYKIGIGIEEIQPGDRTRIINFINKNFVKDYEAI
ncbi:MAG: PilZ domain-containing protein [bacterium]|nr:PilZ domain-containing protein [bacterium]